MNSKRIALVGFDRKTAEVMAAEGLQIIAHIFANPYDKNATYPEQPYLSNFHHWKRYYHESEAAPKDWAQKKRVIQQACFQDFIRSTDRWDWSRELVYNWSDYDHLFSIAFDNACNWLLDHKPDMVVYSNVPHQGMAIVNYHTAIAMGIKTKIFVQSPFEGRSWLVDNWTDFGKFDTSISGEKFEIDISKPDAPPFYMNKIRSDNSRMLRVLGHKLRARTIVGMGLTGFTERIRRRNFQRNMGRWQKAVEDERYYKNVAKFFKDKPTTEPYVYFPLHLQPEMTTDILGGKYADQVLALEDLRMLLPEEIPIYVKENPKQTGRLRSEAFFDRLQKLSNLKFLSRDTPSFPLSENAIAVATIAGTVGWEALRMGKPVITFGNSFWNNLPGAFKYDNNLTWQEISEFKFDAKKLEKAAGQMSKHAHAGICDPVYSVLLKGFEIEENARHLAHTLKNYGGIE